MGRSYKYQNYASFYGLPCYFGSDGCRYYLRGRTWLYDALIPPAAWLHNFFCMVTEILVPQWESEGFPIKIGEELPEELQKELEEEDDSQP